MIGSGTLLPVLQAQIAALPPDVARRITLRGRLGPADLAEVRGRSGVFLMTSHSGYEGFPRVLVEAMATGLPAVVTDGSDTGGLVHQGVSGFVCSRSPASRPFHPRRPAPRPRQGRRRRRRAERTPRGARDFFDGSTEQ